MGGPGSGPQKGGGRSARRSFNKMIKTTTPRSTRRRLAHINQRTKRLGEGKTISGLRGKK